MIDRTNRYYLTTAEMLVMRAIWLADHDMVLSEVVKACNAVYEKNWKPQTVSTYLSHLVQKEFLRMDRNGKIYSYHPIVKAQEYMKYDVQNFVEFWGLTPAEMMKNYLAIRGSSKKSVMNFVPALRKWKKNSQNKYRINGDKSQEMEHFLTFSIYTSKI